MTDEQPLPEGWIRDFEGRRSATYRRQLTGVEVVIEPRYRAEKHPPNKEPESYRIRLRRPFWHHGAGNRIETPLQTVATFEEARHVAREFMENYNGRYRSVHDRGRAITEPDGVRDTDRTASAIAIDAASETVPYSDELLLDHLKSLLGDGLRAVWHADPTGIEPVYTADGAGFDDERRQAVTGALGGVDRETLSEELRQEVQCVSVTLAEYVVYQFVPEPGRSTVIVVDETRDRHAPGFVRQASALVAAREVE